jgi:hypothetical protein
MPAAYGAVVHRKEQAAVIDPMHVLHIDVAELRDAAQLAAECEVHDGQSDTLCPQRRGDRQPRARGRQHGILDVGVLEEERRARRWRVDDLKQHGPQETDADAESRH